jgi:hypothetical protein
LWCFCFHSYIVLSCFSLFLHCFVVFLFSFLHYNVCCDIFLYSYIVLWCFSLLMNYKYIVFLQC